MAADSGEALGVYDGMKVDEAAAVDGVSSEVEIGLE